MAKVVKKSSLTLIELLPLSAGKRRKGLYRCECGAVKEAFVNNVQRLHTTSCGCERKRNSIERFTTHGLRKHPLYRIWADIKTRCTNAGRPEAYLYHGRGVRMCDEWLNGPEFFIKWALEHGWQKGMQIDKDKKAKSAGVPAVLYSPEWCSVLSNPENQNEKSTSRKIEYNGIVKNIMEWSVFLEVPKAKFWYRMKACGFDLYSYMDKWQNKT
ncbi:MAG TPA: hypothetical protein VHL77_00715 [Ferruginibacter sp.]|jgi:hypothetical protein|nr:hypothetical protein [Ferruginibacter sp.]